MCQLMHVLEDSSSVITRSGSTLMEGFVNRHTKLACTLLLFSVVLIIQGCHSCDGPSCGIPPFKVPFHFPAAFWNDGGTIQFNNNCYNYANNKRTDTFAQPGRYAGAMYTSLTCSAVHKAAEADGLKPSSASAECPCKKDKIALVVAPGFDFHWYRLGFDGMWSHKPGGTQATDVDSSGNPISNPETANRGVYTDFCGYFCSCSDSGQGQGHEQIN